jgi:transcriptional regulator with XRE-family HTH domain
VSIAQRLERLFAQTAGPHGRPVTLQEIIHRMEKRGISTMSLSYLQQLRTGQAENPRLQHLRALADAFDVPLSYFLDDDKESEPTAERQLTPEERTIALRVHGLSNDALSSIRAIVELERKSEQLDDPPQAPQDK